MKNYSPNIWKQVALLFILEVELKRNSFAFTAHHFCTLNNAWINTKTSSRSAVKPVYLSSN